jgi:hypothetical protein
MQWTRSETRKSDRRIYRAVRREVGRRVHLGCLVAALALAAWCFLLEGGVGQATAVALAILGTVLVDWVRSGLLP